MPIILIDGVCVLCNGFAQFLIKRDTHHALRFGTLQSDAAKELLRECDSSAARDLTSVVLIEDGAVYTESDAIVKIFSHLGGPYRAAATLKIFPKWFRDAVYRFVGRHRYLWFGKKDACMIPTPEMKDRFLL